MSKKRKGNKLLILRDVIGNANRTANPVQEFADSALIDGRGELVHGVVVVEIFYFFFEKRSAGADTITSMQQGKNGISFKCSCNKRKVIQTKASVGRFPIDTGGKA